MLETRDINGIPVFRPGEQSEAFVYEHIKGRLFERHASGVYTDIEVVTDIINGMFKDYEALLDDYLPQVDHQAALGFLLDQYDLYALAVAQFKQRQLTADDEELWHATAGFARRGIKYLVELLCSRGLAGGTRLGTQAQQEHALSVLFIAGEELVSLYMRSEHYRSLLREVELVLDASQYVYFSVEQDLSSPPWDVRDDVMEVDRYVPQPDFLRDPQRHNEVIGASFVERFGVDYLHVVAGLQFLVTSLHERAPQNEPCIVLRHEAVAMLARYLSITRQQATLIIDGFSLTAENMLLQEQDKGRLLFRPKQEYRAYKRGFFAFELDHKPVLVFSSHMARECLDLLVADIPFRKVPPEWHTPAITAALDKLALQAGRWFEGVVASNLKDAGIQTIGSVQVLTFKDGRRVKVPPAVGEIDLLGYSAASKRIVVIEVKQVGFSTEPRLFKDDLVNFVTGKRNYADKFAAKFRWVIDNHLLVGEFLAERLACAVPAEAVGYAMVTHYPLFVARHISQFSCLSITEFMRRSQAQDQWVFSQTPLPDDTE